MQATQSPRKKHVHAGQFDFFSASEPPPTPATTASAAATPKKEPRPPAQIITMQPARPAPPPRAQPVGHDRFYDVLYQFESYRDTQILTKEEFDAAEALDPHNPAEEESESDLQQVQALSSAIVEAIHQDDFDQYGVMSDQVLVDVFNVTANDTASQRLAKAMFSRMLYDLAVLNPTAADVIDEDGLDLFGQKQLKNCKRDYAEMRKFDALIWVFSLSPDAPRVTFEWVCEQLGFDESRICRIIARSVKKDLRQVLRFLAGLTDVEHTKACQAALADFVNLDSWETVDRFG